MRILLDLQGCQTESRLRGIGRYSFSLAKAFLAQAQHHDVWVLLNRQLPAVEDLRFKLKDDLPADQIIVFDVPSKSAWGSVNNAWRRPVAELIREQVIRSINPDVIHISSLFEGLFSEDAVTSVSRLDSDILTAVTLYDLIPLLSPELHLVAEQQHQGYMDKVSYLKKADLLLSISEYSRQEAIENLQISSDRIVNISSAQNPEFRPAQGREVGQASLQRYGITKPYVMYNGAFDPRKNIDRLIQTFALLDPDLRKQYQLVLVGKVAPVHQFRLEQLAKKLHIFDSVIFTNYIDDKNLLNLFQLASVFMFPSLHEGFGLPALEAMSCGIPTIGSNVTSIPEVIGRADALFNPLDTADMAEKLSAVLLNTSFAMELAAHALDKAKQFSWKHSAHTTLEALEALYERSPRRKLRPTLSWGEQQGLWDQQYQELIASIAIIPMGVDSPRYQDLVATAACIAANQAQMQLIARAHTLPEVLSWRIEGPFDSSYSLALLNRETARALEGLGHTVALHSTEGPGDFLPSPNFLRANPDLAQMYEKSLSCALIDSDVTSRNLYPPRVVDMTSRMNLLHHYAWEESGFPEEWVADFNQYLQGITCLSSHVQKIMIDSGVNIPLCVSGCGVDHWERVSPDEGYLVHGKTFRFLHVSSCFPRKGVEILLEAYGRAFTSQDEVTLIIKTFPNPHNEIRRWLRYAQAQFENYPDVQIIEDDLSQAQLKSLYLQSHALVAPSYAEGFGLPLAEAMLSNLPVITTGWGGQLDFCNSETALLVDYSFELAQTHFGLFDSVWARPDVAHLSHLMKEVLAEPASAKDLRIQRAKKLLQDRFTWRSVSQRLVEAARTWAPIRTRAHPKIGWVSTWQAQCGIATYSEALLQEMPGDTVIFAPKREVPFNQSAADDRYEVVYCWEAGDHGRSLRALAEAIAEHPVDILVMQFQYSFYEIDELGRFLTQQLDLGQKIVLMMHATNDPIAVLPHQQLFKIATELKQCDRILVHTPADLNRLKLLGLVENVTLFPHGILDAPRPVKNGLKQPGDEDLTHAERFYFQVASYGFFLPHKGLLELIEAISLLRNKGLDVRLHMINAAYPASISREHIVSARKMIRSLGLNSFVTLTTDYLEDNESLMLLAKADLLIFPYQVTGESASGAVRIGLASGTQVAVTPLPIFDDVAPAVTTMPGFSPEEIAQGIENHMRLALEDPGRLNVLKEQAARWCDAHRYRSLGPRLYRILQSLVGAS